MPPTLTVCVPTHDGRARTIRDTLTSIAEQLRPEHAGRVDVAVRDNASQDGTDAVVAELAAAGLPVSYARNPRNVGFARNLDLVVEQATGDWCWLLSSDDRLRPGALDRALALLQAHPEIDGMTVDEVVLDRHLRDPVRDQTTPVVPAELDEVTVLRGADAVVGAVGWIMSGVSTLVVRRRRWIEAGPALRASADHAGSWYPHVAVPLRIVGTDGAWLWCPEKLVDARSGNVDAILDRGPRLQGELLMHLDATWGAVVGARSPGRRAARRRYRRGLEALGTVAHVRADRLRTPRDSAWLLWTFARILGREPAFWRRIAWRLVVPARIARPARRWPAVPAPAAARTPGPPEPEPAAAPAPAGRSVVAADLPRRARPADMLAIRCHVTADGSAPRLLRARWTSAAGERVEGPSLALPRRRRGGRRSAVLALNAPVALGDWELRVAARPAGPWEAGEGDAVGTVTVRP
ncbi:glycosyltransferase family 2 protein [Patulibacter sp. SYSU D01012]|uniref:glycosyltransferase family 2 protein n=1 Tax=Patulibacter sp. SYSU D01012 TaxID=2817381 RepID=UPI001B317A06|nr:glycosyltransferase family 2 protein [Patulibacter sp. SYSU D01012]